MSAYFLFAAAALAALFVLALLLDLARRKYIDWRETRQRLILDRDARRFCIVVDLRGTKDRPR